MPREPDAGEVVARLAALRVRYQPESVDDARRRFACERILTHDPLGLAAARRLAELRALCELADHLHRGSPPR